MRTTPDHPNPFYEPEDCEWFALEDLPRRQRAKGLSWLLNTLILAGTSVLSITVLSSYQGHNFRSQGQLTACKSNLKNIGTAMEIYSTDFAGAYPPTLNHLAPKYLKNLPDCPDAKKMTYRASFGPTAPTNIENFNEFYYLECAGQNHQKAGIRGDYPAYNGVVGLIEEAPTPQPAVVSPTASPSRLPVRQ